MKSIILFSFLFLSAFSIKAQTDTLKTNEKALYLVVKTDGNEFYGFILEDDGREILLETKTIGKIYINKSEISKIEKVEDVSYNESGDAEYKDHREEGAFTTRYYFTTNALPIKKKDNYALIHLYGPEVHFAVSDNFSIGVMATWIASPIAVAMKYSFNSTGKTHLAFGTILGSSGYLFNASGFGGLHWATITHGDRKANISFSAGYSYVGGVSSIFNRNQYYGEGAIVQSSDLSQPYYVGDYDAEAAVRNKYPGLYNSQVAKNVNGAAVLGLSGIAPIGQKASFIFDSMTFISKDNTQNYSVEYTSTTEEFTYTDYDSGNQTTVTEDITFGKGELIGETSNTYKATLILMPAMRFNTSYKSSFQVALAGVINIKSTGVTSFPAPMVSWLKKF
jgi:hypothetical protein